MNTETNTPQGGGEAIAADQGTAAPAAQSQAPARPAPRSDAEAELQEQQIKAEADEAAKNKDKQPDQNGEKKKNRTREYIERINGENRTLRTELEEIKSRLPPKQEEKANERPKLEDFNFDYEAHAEAVAKWAIQQDRANQQKEQGKTDEQQKVNDTLKSYEERALKFADEHDDFFEAVSSIKFLPSPQAQFAIMAHERGPEIAYHLANNDDDAFLIANVQPHLADAAVERIAARLTPAQTTDVVPGQGSDANNNPTAAAAKGAQAAPQQPAKPISQAPQPAPTVSGRAANETPPEKMTDDEWYKRDRERRRKR